MTARAFAHRYREDLQVGGGGMMVALTPPLGPALLLRVDPPTVVFECVCAEEKRASGAFFFFGFPLPS